MARPPPVGGLEEPVQFGRAPAGDDYPALGVDGHCVGATRGTDLRPDPPVAPERAVEAAVRLVPGEHDIYWVGARPVPVPALADGDDSVLGVDRHPLGGFGVAEVRAHPAVAAERAVEAAVRPVSGEHEVVAAVCEGIGAAGDHDPI